jgi:L-alanine-DL-glutamate epimerase-like enolase superfamily enzyme
MKIKSVKAFWVHVPIAPERQHTSDFGRTLSFDATLVRIDTQCGLIGWGEAKARVGGMAQNQALTSMINDEFAPILIGEDPRDITRLWETLYSGSRAHYALREGRVLPVLGANPLLHDLVEEPFPVEDGMIAVPDRPGLGITVREDFLRKHTVSPGGRP